MSREHQQMRVRLPPELKDSLDQLAKENGRSMNAEIVYRLQKSVSDELEAASADSGEVGDVHYIDFQNLSLTPRAPTLWNPRLTEELKEVLDYIRQEMKNKKS
ncbi:Arc family DNA-binding protein [Aeromonas veronii]|jgi:hypothetical protein|uniref:Arc family DNA-binding protein n=1 Tax=Aeromonas veronii TaxID=654 RepID=UPI003007DAC2